MEIFINLLNDLIIIVGNLIIFSCMLGFKTLKTFKKVILIVICAILTVAYSLCVYLFDVPMIHATFLCFTIPSMVSFWFLSDIKDSRFFLTFCFVDTISLIIAAITKAIAFLLPSFAIYITLVLNIALYTALIVLGYKTFSRYAQLLKYQKKGWTSMMIASFIIYFALYFLAAFPEPLKDRLEYTIPYFVFCVVILSCYVVFWNSIVKTKKIQDQYEQLEKEKIYHKIAYTDSLTGLYNRAYYIEKINELERDYEDTENVCSIVIDINDFKNINDNYGHHIGDEVLKEVATIISNEFADLSSTTFRMGGDEFYILIMDADKNEIKNRLDNINPLIKANAILKDYTLSIAYGYSVYNVKDNEFKPTIEQNFINADKNMYENKSHYKSAYENYDYFVE